MKDAHTRTLELVAGLDENQLIGPRLQIVNPLRWEIGHVAWFYEKFILRDLYDQAPYHALGDDIYDSINVTLAEPYVGSVYQFEIQYTRPNQNLAIGLSIAAMSVFTLAVVFFLRQRAR